jgi:O-antigen ligase
MVLLDPSNLLLWVLGLVVLGLKLWALVDACVRPSPAYEAAGKLNKLAWIAILAAAVLLGGGNVLGLLGLIGTIAAIVYLVDVRPAVRSMRPGGPWA